MAIMRCVAECDYCGNKEEFPDEYEMHEDGWLVVTYYDSISEELKEKAYCDGICLESDDFYG